MAIVLGLAGLYVVLSVVLWALQEKITFPAPRANLPDPLKTLGYGEQIELRMHDGTKLVGWYLPPLRRPSPPSAAFLWFYGNGETIGAIWPIIRDFRPPNAALLVVDYPGYGASGGRATEAGVYEAADLAYNALVARPEIDRHRIYVYGRSLGTKHYGIFPRFLVRLQLDNVGAISRVHCPILIFHGTADMLVPITMGREVAAAAGGPVEFVMIEGAGHNDTYDLGGNAYKAKLAAFVK